MGFSIRATLLTLVALGSGCVTGHLLNTGRRYERPLVYHEALLTEDRLVLRYTAIETNDIGRPTGRHERQVALALADLARDDVPVDAFPVEQLSDHAVVAGRPVALRRGGATAPALCLDLDATPDGRDVGFVLQEDGRRSAPFHSVALTRSRTVPWVYPLLPLSLAADAAIDPVLFLFAPAVIGVGD